MKKYSVIIPAKNGLPYLRWAVASVLSEPSETLELVVSVDSSEDGSLQFAQSLDDSRVRVFAPPSSLSMSEHWDFAQSKSTGQWQIFLGQDDLLAEGYFKKLEAMTNEAQLREISAIVGRRAYINWEGVNNHDLPAIQSWGTLGAKVVSTQEFIARALYNQISYHEGPQAYTSSLVNREVFDAIRAGNQGRLITGHPQDAFLAASILKETGRFLYFRQPFSFVGTSTQSAGLAVSGQTDKLSSDQVALREKYLNSILNSPIEKGRDSSFRHGCNSRYFLDALRATYGPEQLHELRVPLSKLRFDANLLMSGVEKRLSRAELGRLLESRLPLFFPRALALLIGQTQKTLNAIQRFGARLIYKTNSSAFELVRVLGPVTNLEIMALLTKVTKGPSEVGTSEVGK
jgi:glycosyltransferase involved in cell wall biosynthesis